MDVKLTRELKPIKNGWVSRSPTLHLAAHGRSEDVADQNLQRAARLFLTPFQRQGTLQAEATILGLHVTGDQGDLQVTLE